MIRRRDGNDNVKNKQTIGLEGKATILLARCTFLYNFFALFAPPRPEIT